MTFNRKQKITSLVGLSLILISIIIWLGYGGEIFTKDQVLIEKTDELFGTTYTEWKDKFILGLDYTAVFSGIVFLVTAVIVFFQRKKSD